MSGEQESLDDVEMDPEAAMREMMGFSSFTTRPKNRPDSNTAQTLPQAPAASNMTNDHQNPLTGPNRIASSIFNSLDRRGSRQEPLMTSSTAEATPSVATQSQHAYAFTSPQTGIAYTAQELQVFSNGKVNERGDKVYFKPGFVVEDPWFRLRKQEPGSESAGGSRGKRSREPGASEEAGH